MMASRLPALALPALLLTPARAAAQWDHAHPAVRVGHAYSSAEALGQPATFVLHKEDAQPWLTLLDVGALLSLEAGRGWFEVGARAAAGSARSPARRIYGGVARANRHLAPLVVALAGEYEADGGFDVQKGLVSLELTPAAVPALAIGIPRHGLRWRPWLAAGYGTVFDTDQAAADVEDDGFFRAYARAEVTWEPAFAPLRFGLEGTSWLVDGDVRGTSHLKGALSLPAGAGFSVSLTAEAGRQPPRFAYDERLAIGLGFRR